MAEKFIRDLEPLAESEESTAIIPVSRINDTGVERWIDIPGLVDIQQHLDPLTMAIRQMPLAEFSGVDANNRASTTEANTLDFGESRTEQAFIDSDMFLVVKVSDNVSI